MFFSTYTLSIFKTTGDFGNFFIWFPTFSKLQLMISLIKLPPQHSPLLWVLMYVGVIFIVVSYGKILRITELHVFASPFFWLLFFHFLIFSYTYYSFHIISFGKINVSFGQWTGCASTLIFRMRVYMRGPVRSAWMNQHFGRLFFLHSLSRNSFSCPHIVFFSVQRGPLGTCLSNLVGYG